MGFILDKPAGASTEGANGHLSEVRRLLVMEMRPLRPVGVA
jgi:hypothetical protein